MFIQVFIHVHVTIAPKSFKDLFKNDILKKYIYIFVKKIIYKHVLDLNSSVSHTCIKKTPSLQEGANKGKRRTVGGFLVKKSNCLVCSSGRRFLDVSVIASLCIKEDHKGNTLTETSTTHQEMS